jgi:flagellar basal-body rod modification protein FlgD
MQLFASPVTSSPITAAQPTDSGSTAGGSAADANSATVSANDFLQLLVTEMKNQDPTADTDPNEYINQLVQVNSLEQLISINQDLGGASSSGSTAGSSTSGNAASGSGAQSGAIPALANGNLSATDTGSSGSRIADALGAAAQTLAPNAANSPLSAAVESLRNRAHNAINNVSNPAH